MARRWIVVALVFVAAAAIGGGLALALNGDDGSDDAARSSSTTASTRAVASTVGSSTSTTTPASTATTATTTPARSRDSAPDPCGAEQAAISAAIAASPGFASPTEIAQCRFAASDRRWVAAVLDDRVAGEATVLLVQENGAWRVVARGTDNVGCGLAPQAVLVDLGLLCIGSGGG